eukprot:gene4216-4410_t
MVQVRGPLARWDSAIGIAVLSAWTTSDMTMVMDK